MAQHSDKPINTLRLSRRDRERILREISRPRRLRAGGVERRRVRVRFDTDRVFVALARSDGEAIKYSVVPRNLSAKGMAFIHGQYIHEDSRCEVVMAALDGTWSRSFGSVVTCRHLQGIVHEASVVFDEPVELEQFVSLDPEQQRLADREGDQDVDRSMRSLAGRALVFSPGTAVRNRMKKLLRNMGLTVDASDDLAETLNMLLGGYDLLLLDPAGRADGWSVVRRMREAGISVPIIGLCEQDSDDSRAASLGAGCNAYLPRDAKDRAMRMTVEQLMMIEPTEMRIMSVIDSCAADLRTISDALEQAQAGEDWESIASLCQRLKGTVTDLSDVVRRA